MGINALASQGLVFHMFAAALWRGITGPCWKPPVAKAGRKGKEELRRGGRKVLVLKEKHRLLLLHLPAKRYEGPLVCARTLPSAAGNMVEQGISPSQGWDSANQGYGGYGVGTPPNPWPKHCSVVPCIRCSWCCDAGVEEHVPPLWFPPFLESTSDLVNTSSEEQV